MLKHELIRKILFVLGVVLVIKWAPSSEAIPGTTIAQIGMDLHKIQNMPTDFPDIRYAWPFYAKIRVRNSGGEVINLIVNNGDFALFLARERSLDPDKVGVDAYKRFSNTIYVEYMRAHADKVLDINLNSFKKFIMDRAHSSDEAIGEEYVEHARFDKPLTFQQLGVKTESELLSKYFTFDAGKGFGYLKHEFDRLYSTNPAFIATLIDLGYVAAHGDIVPALFIRQIPNH